MVTPNLRQYCTIWIGIEQMILSVVDGGKQHLQDDKRCRRGYQVDSTRKSLEHVTWIHERVEREHSSQAHDK